MNSTFEQNTFGDRFLRSLNGNAFDKRSASDVFERHFDQDFGEPDQLLVIVGSDSGLLLDHFASSTLGRATKVLIVEPDTIVEQIAADRDLPEADADVRLLRESEWLASLRTESLPGYVFSGKLMMLMSVACKLGFDDRYEALALDVRRAMAQTAYKIATQVNSQIFIERHLQNAPFNTDSVAMLRGIGEGCTAVILGGGPSLDRDLPWIMANRARLTIIAVSRLCEKLDRIGLRPDMVVSVDPQHGMYEISKAGIRWEDTLLVHQYHVVPALLQQWRGPTLRLGPALPWPSALEGKLPNVAGPGPTVSHAATWMAYELGFRQILLTGVDLCFSADGNTHASDTPEARLATSTIAGDQVVSTYGGRLAKTNIGLKTSLVNLEMLVATIDAAGVSVINLSEEAARIERIEHRDAADIDLPTRKADIGALDVVGATPETCRKLRRELHTMIRALVMVRKCSRKADKYLDRLHGLDGRPADYRYKAKLDHLEASLEKSFGPAMSMIKLYSGPALTALCNPSGFDDMDEKTMADWGKSYYRILANTARTLNTKLADAVEALTFREMEDAPQPDIDALLTYWQRVGIMGRTWHVLQHRSENLDAKDHDRLSVALQQFAATLDDDKTNFASSLARLSSNAQGIVRRLNTLQESNDEATLQTLTNRLLNGAGVQVTLGALAQGYLAELRDDPATAIDCFETVIDALGTQLETTGALDADHLPMLEPSLLHTAQAHLANGNKVAAIESLGVLTQHAIDHAPRYAGLLRAQGFVEQAIEALDIYLDARPDDWRMREEIAEMHKLLGDDVSAQAAMEIADQTRVANALQRAA